MQLQAIMAQPHQAQQHMQQAAARQQQQPSAAATAPGDADLQAVLQDPASIQQEGLLAREVCQCGAQSLAQALCQLHPHCVGCSQKAQAAQPLAPSQATVTTGAPLHLPLHRRLARTCHAACLAAAHTTLAGAAAAV